MLLGGRCARCGWVMGVGAPRRPRPRYRFLPVGRLAGARTHGALSCRGPAGRISSIPARGWPGRPGSWQPTPTTLGTAAKPDHRARSRAAVATCPPAPSALPPTHLAGTRLLRSDLTARPRQSGAAGSVFVGVPQQHPGRAGGCGHAGGPGWSLEAWGPQGRGARWGPRASSGQGKGGRREPGLRPRQRRGPGAAFPFPFSPAAGGGRRGSAPRATWWAGGGAVAQATAESILHP